MENENAKNSQLGESTFTLHEAVVDAEALRIVHRDRTEKLEPKVMGVLLALAQRHGRVVSRHELEDLVWEGRMVSDDAVTNAVGKLRKSLDDHPCEPRFIETIPKRGYRLIPEPLAQAPASRGVPKAGRPVCRRCIATAALVLISVVAWVLWSKQNNDSVLERWPSIRTIAVLPFESPGAGPNEDYFELGITHDLIADLSRQPGLRVIAPATAFSYDDSSMDDRSIGEELGVHYLVRGDVQREGERVRLEIRLLDIYSGQLLWTNRFDAMATEIFEIQDSLVDGILRGLQSDSSARLPHVERSSVTDSLEAYEEYLRGRKYYGRITPDDNLSAMQHFARAIELDSGFARAYAGMALTWSRQAIDGWVEDPEASLDKAMEYAEKAAAIDPDLPQIHFVRGQAALFRGDHKAAAFAATLATELDPNYADAYGLLAWITHYGGRPEIARRSLREALRRNPASSASYEQIAGEIDFCTGRYAEAASSFQAALRHNPTHARARLWLAISLLQLGRRDDAEWEVQELLTINPHFSIARMLFAFPHKDPDFLRVLNDAVRQLGLAGQS